MAIFDKMEQYGMNGPITDEFRVDGLEDNVQSHIYKLFFLTGYHRLPSNCNSSLLVELGRNIFLNEFSHTK